MNVELNTCSRHRLCDDFVVEDYVARSWDVAFLLGGNHPDPGLMTRLAQHLGRFRADSEVFEALLERTAEFIESDLEQDEDDPTDFPRVRTALPATQL